MTLFFDVGANIGFYSLLSTLSPHAKKVYSFEAISDTFCELEKNISLNSLQDKISVYNLAVSDKKRIINLSC